MSTVGRFRARGGAKRVAHRDEATLAAPHARLLAPEVVDVRRTVTAHGGAMRFETEPGHTVFVVRRDPPLADR